jgi:hypothetical protein
MANVHMLIGMGEAGITALVVAAVARVRPDLLALSKPRYSGARRSPPALSEAEGEGAYFTRECEIGGLAPIEAADGDPICRDPFSHPDLGRLTRALAGMAAEHGMAVQSCAEDPRLESLGIKPGNCIDADLINRLFGTCLKNTKDKGQRPHCLCAVARDIGAVDTCLHGCAYCYSTSSHERALERARRHDPSSPILIPAPCP